MALFPARLAASGAAPEPEPEPTREQTLEEQAQRLVDAISASLEAQQPEPEGPPPLGRFQAIARALSTFGNPEREAFVRADIERRSPAAAQARQREFQQRQLERQGAMLQLVRGEQAHIQQQEALRTEQRRAQADEEWTRFQRKQAGEKIKADAARMAAFPERTLREVENFQETVKPLNEFLDFLIENGDRAAGPMKELLNSRMRNLQAFAEDLAARGVATEADIDEWTKLMDDYSEVYRSVLGRQQGVPVEWVHKDTLEELEKNQVLATSASNALRFFENNPAMGSMWLNLRNVFGTRALTKEEKEAKAELEKITSQIRKDIFGSALTETEKQNALGFIPEFGMNAESVSFGLRAIRDLATDRNRLTIKNQEIMGRMIPPDITVGRQPVGQETIIPGVLNIPEGAEVIDFVFRGERAWKMIDPETGKETIYIGTIDEPVVEDRPAPTKTPPPEKGEPTVVGKTIGGIGVGLSAAGEGIMDIPGIISGALTGGPRKKKEPEKKRRRDAPTAEEILAMFQGGQVGR